MSRLGYAAGPDVGEPLCCGQSSPYSPNLGCEPFQLRWKARPYGYATYGWYVGTIVGPCLSAHLFCMDQGSGIPDG